MLTKEQCENALSESKIYLKNQMLKKERISHSVYLLNTVTSLFERLIHEHFYNPPLKFEELKEGMWVWDNKRKVKLLIAYCYSEDDMGYYNLSNPEDYKYVHIEFEENRFYRKQVEE